MAVESIRKIMPKRKHQNARARALEHKIDLFGSLLNIHMHRLIGRHKLGQNHSLISLVSQITGRQLSYGEAWEWLLEDYQKDPAREPWEWHDQCVAEMRKSLKRVRKEAEERRAARLAREAALAAQQIPGAEFYQSLAWRELRYKVLAKAAGCCEACRRAARDHGVTLHVDHIMPRSQFPDLALEETNLQVLCEDCNIGKGTDDTTDWRTAPQGVDT